MQHLYHALHIMPEALPSSTQVWKDGRYESTRSCCGTKTSMWLRSVPFQPSSSFCEGGGGGGRRVASSECARAAQRAGSARDRATHRHKVLAARAGLQRVRRLGGVLKALDEVGRVLAADKGVLARRLDVAAPARVCAARAREEGGRVYSKLRARASDGTAVRITRATHRGRC